MPSTFTTDPVGPRSVDEMLGVVYTRADRLRRRRAAHRFGAAAVAAVVAFVGLASVRGDDSASRVRAIDRPSTEKEASAPPSVDLPAAQAAAPTPAAAPPLRAEVPRVKGSGEVDASVARPQAVPPLPDQGRPRIETWGKDADALNDASPNKWYLDIAATTMQFEVAAEVVVFTTHYRLPDQPLEEARDTRVLESSFDYDDHVFTVEVRESGNAFGTVTIDDVFDCTECSARFEAAAGRLEVRVPLAKLNEAVTRHSDKPLGPGAEVMSLRALTSHVQANLPPVRADSSPGTGG